MGCRRFAQFVLIHEARGSMWEFPKIKVPLKGILKGFLKGIYKGSIKGLGFRVSELQGVPLYGGSLY